MNENKKLIILVAIAFVFLGIIGLVYYDSYKTAKAEVEKFYTAFKSEKEQVIFIGRETCYYCNLAKPIMEDFNNQYKFNYVYIDTDLINNEQLTQILNTLKVNPDDFGTPYTVIAKNNEVIKDFHGAGSESQILNFLKESNIIVNEEANLINYINYEEYQKLLNKANSLIVVGDSTNENYKTMMNDLRKLRTEKNVVINYFSILEITEETSSEFSNVVLPSMIITNNKKEQITLTGVKTYDEYLTFLQKNGIIK